MSKLSKKAVLSVLSLVLTFVALGATTFAWFTLGNTASVGQFDAEIRGSEGLEIRFGRVTGNDTTWEKNWYSNINSNTMGEYIDSIFNKESARLEAVTTENGKENFQKFNDSDLNNFYTNAEANKDYIEFKLQFRTMNGGMELALNQLILTSDEINNWTPDIEFTNEFGTPVTPDSDSWSIHPHHALRVSLDDGNNTVKLESGEDESPGNIGFDNGKGAFDYFTKKLDLTEADKTILENKKENGMSETNDIDDAVFSFYDGTDDLEGYQVLELTLRVWIEGWDGNAYDAIFGGKIHVGFDFELVDEQ